MPADLPVRQIEIGHCFVAKLTLNQAGGPSLGNRFQDAIHRFRPRRSRKPKLPLAIVIRNPDQVNLRHASLCMETVASH